MRDDDDVCLTWQEEKAMCLLQGTKEASFWRLCSSFLLLEHTLSLLVKFMSSEIPLYCR